MKKIVLILIIMIFSISCVYAEENTTSESSIISHDVTKYYKNDTQYYATLNDGNGSALKNTNVTLNINGENYQRQTNESGVVKLSINLNPGKYLLNIINPITKESKTNNITVLTTVHGNDIVKYYRNATPYTATFLDGEGNPLKNTNVTFNINGVFYTRKTNENGTAKLNINLNPSKYTITAKNDLNGELSSNVIEVLKTVNGSDIKKYYRNGTQYYATFLDHQGNPLNNTDVKFNINGVFYTRKTNENGTAKLNINLNPGTYTITAINTNNNDKFSNKITVLSKIITKTITVGYRANGSYQATVVNGEGKPQANQTVKLNINGRIYERVSDENGTVKLTINLNPGSYICTAYWNDSSTGSKVSVSRVSVKMNVFNTTLKRDDYYRVQILDSKTNKPIANMKVIFTFNQTRAYYVHTGADGIAGIQINRFSDNEIPLGTYQMISSTEATSWYNDLAKYFKITIIE